MARLAPGKKCNKNAPVCPKLGLVSEVWEKYGSTYIQKLSIDYLHFLETK
jgi:hypothetical protein